MTLNKRIEAFSKLGEFLSNYATKTADSLPNKEASFSSALDAAINTAIIHNSWFTKEDILLTIKHWSTQLTTDNLQNWAKDYDIPDTTSEKTVAVIMAGNIPLAGFHDFIAVLIAGYHILIKLSSKDKQLLPLLYRFLEDYEPEFKGLIRFTDDRLTGFDAVIATGSNNTARYFEYYFSKKPHIIRKNRNSIAILNGSETKEELNQLGSDIFTYYGLGCRNVSKLMVPKDYDFSQFYQGIYDWHPIVQSHKYANNYDYNKAVYLMSEFKILDNGFLILKEDTGLSSPIASLFYQYYNDQDELSSILETQKEDIQCLVSQNDNSKHVRFGQTQYPNLTDYADNIDSLEFLNSF